MINSNMTHAFYSTPELFPGGNKWVPGQLKGTVSRKIKTAGLIHSCCAGPDGKFAIMHGAASVSVVGADGQFIWESTALKALRRGRLAGGVWPTEGLIMCNLEGGGMARLSTTDGQNLPFSPQAFVLRGSMFRRGFDWCVRSPAGNSSVFRLLEKDGSLGAPADFDIRFCPGWGGQVEFAPGDSPSVTCIASGSWTLYNAFCGKRGQDYHLKLVPGTELERAITIDRGWDTFIAEDQQLLVTAHFDGAREAGPDAQGCWVYQGCWLSVRKLSSPDEVLWSTGVFERPEWILGVGADVIYPLHTITADKEGDLLVCRSIATGEVRWTLPVDGSCTAFCRDGQLVCAGSRSVTVIE